MRQLCTARSRRDSAEPARAPTPRCTDSAGTGDTLLTPDMHRVCPRCRAKMSVGRRPTWMSLRGATRSCRAIGVGSAICNSGDQPQILRCHGKLAVRAPARGDRGGDAGDRVQFGPFAWFRYVAADSHAAARQTPANRSPAPRGVQRRSSRVHIITRNVSRP